LVGGFVFSGICGLRGALDDAPIPAIVAERDYIPFLVTTRVAPTILVVHPQVLHATAHLAPPVITLQRMAVQFAVISSAILIPILFAPGPAGLCEEYGR